MVVLIGQYPDHFMLYIPAASRRRFAKFREHLENEGKRVSDVVMELIDGYMKFNAETEE